MLYDYQKKLYRSVEYKFRKEDVVCLAAVTGVGKTEIAINMMKSKKSKRFLVLAHNQSVLRTNFFTRMADKFSSKELVQVKNKSDLLAANKARVVVAIPAGIHRYLDKLDNFDYIIVDEAHHYYSSENKMYGKINEWHGGKTLLLTASHYQLKFPKIFFSRENAIDIGKSENVNTTLWLDSTKLKDNDFHNHEVKESVKIKFAKDTYTVIEENIEGPTLITTHSKLAADEIGKKLKKKYKLCISHSGNDKDSIHLEEFKQGKYDVCVVVNRAVLGFDYPNLNTFIDVSYSGNVQRLEQQVGRLTRKGNVKVKKYVKIAPRDRAFFYKLCLTAVNALVSHELYTTWDGVQETMRIRLPKSDLEKPKEISEPSDQEVTPRGPKGGGAALEMMFGSYLTMWEGSDWWEETTFKKALETVARWNSNCPWIYYETAEEFVDFLKPFGVVSNVDWVKKHQASLGTAGRKGVYKQVVNLLGWTTLKSWDYDSVLNSARKYKGIRDWQKREGGAYTWARTNNKFQEIKDLLVKEGVWTVKNSWDYESVLKSARKYKGIGDWQKREGGAVRWAYNNNKYQEIKKLMIKEGRWKT